MISSARLALSCFGKTGGLEDGEEEGEGMLGDDKDGQPYVKNFTNEIINIK